MSAGEGLRTRRAHLLQRDHGLGALTELFPGWAERGAPLKQAVSKDEFLFLDETGAKSTPALFLPECFNSHDNHIVSLSSVTRWLAQQIEVMGVEIFPGSATDEVLYGGNGAGRGVATGNNPFHPA